MKHGNPYTVLPSAKPKTAPIVCIESGCGGRVVGRGWCTKHYQRWAKHDDPSMDTLGRDLSVEDRFWLKVDKNGPTPELRPELGPCWVWTRGKSDGYGMFWINGKQRQAHAVAHEWERGPIPGGFERDHLCRNRACCRPSHLQVVTHAVNTERGVSPHGLNTKKTYCPQGHEYNEENTRVNNQGKRVCKICAKAAMHRWYLKSKGRTA